MSASSSSASAAAKTTVAKLDLKEWYSEDKINRLLERLLPNAVRLPQTQFEHSDLLKANLRQALLEVKSNRPAVLPINLHGNHWSGLIIKKKPNDQLQVIYNDPKGNSIESETNAALIVAAITAADSKAEMIELRYEQQNNDNDCGPFTVDNLVKLATHNTEVKDIRNPQEIIGILNSHQQNRNIGEVLRTEQQGTLTAEANTANAAPGRPSNAHHSAMYRAGADAKNSDTKTQIIPVAKKREPLDDTAQELPTETQMIREVVKMAVKYGPDAYAKVKAMFTSGHQESKQADGKENTTVTTTQSPLSSNALTNLGMITEVLSYVNPKKFDEEAKGFINLVSPFIGKYEKDLRGFAKTISENLETANNNPAFKLVKTLASEVGNLANGLNDNKDSLVVDSKLSDAASGIVSLINQTKAIPDSAIKEVAEGLLSNVHEITQRGFAVYQQTDKLYEGMQKLIEKRGDISSQITATEEKLTQQKRMLQRNRDSKEAADEITRLETHLSKLSDDLNTNKRDMIETRQNITKTLDKQATILPKIADRLAQVSVGINFVAGMVAPVNPELGNAISAVGDVAGRLAGAVSSAATMAASGAVLGPIGAAVGGIVGFVAGGGGQLIHDAYNLITGRRSEESRIVEYQQTHQLLVQQTQQIAGMFNQMQVHVDSRFDKVEKLVLTVAEHVEKRFDRLEEVLGEYNQQVHGRFDRLEDILGRYNVALHGRFDRLEGAMVKQGQFMIAAHQSMHDRFNRTEQIMQALHYRQIDVLTKMLHVRFDQITQGLSMIHADSMRCFTELYKKSHETLMIVERIQKDVRELEKQMTRYFQESALTDYEKAKYTLQKETKASEKKLENAAITFARYASNTSVAETFSHPPIYMEGSLDDKTVNAAALVGKSFFGQSLKLTHLKILHQYATFYNRSLGGGFSADDIANPWLLCEATQYYMNCYYRNPKLVADAKQVRGIKERFAALNGFIHQLSTNADYFHGLFKGYRSHLRNILTGMELHLSTDAKATPLKKELADYLFAQQSISMNLAKESTLLSAELREAESKSTAIVREGLTPEKNWAIFKNYFAGLSAKQIALLHDILNNLLEQPGFRRELEVLEAYRIMIQAYVSLVYHDHLQNRHPLLQHYNESLWSQANIQTAIKQREPKVFVYSLLRDNLSAVETYENALLELIMAEKNRTGQKINFAVIQDMADALDRFGEVMCKDVPEPKPELRVASDDKSPATVIPEAKKKMIGDLIENLENIMSLVQEQKVDAVNDKANALTIKINEIKAKLKDGSLILEEVRLLQNPLKLFALAISKFGNLKEFADMIKIESDNIIPIVGTGIVITGIFAGGSPRDAASPGTPPTPASAAAPAARK